MRTKEQYIEALSKMKKNVYFNGEKIDRTDEVQMNCIDTIATTYDLAQDPEHADLMLAKSHLTGETINRFTHIHQSPEDLHKKQDMTRMLCCKVGGCIQRCMGIDATNALYTISYEADKLHDGKTQYHENFKKWLLRFQSEDLIAACAQTDVKGDRLLRPAEQPDPDAYVHITEKREDGIVVNGCKLHISEASVSDEILVIPTRALRKDDADYAVAFAVPADAEGVIQVATMHNLRPREHFKRGLLSQSTDSYVIFDNCFIPWERVFLCGEYGLGGLLALLFSLFHRHSYSGCKPAIGDMYLGTAALAAEVNNIHKASHVREKLSELIMITELGYAAGHTASTLAKPEILIPGKGFIPFGPGNYIPHSIYANVGRCLTGESVYKEQEILCDIAGGVVATFPHERDFANPETKEYLEKYTKRNPDMPVEDQAQLWRHLGDIMCSATGGIKAIGGYHGGGSPIMEQIAITSQYDIEKRKDMVRELAGMNPRKKDKK